MAEFECSVKDLMNGNTNEKNIKTAPIEEVKSNAEFLYKSDASGPELKGENLSLYEKAYTDKNIKIILFILLLYLILSSQIFYNILGNNFSSLFDSVTDSPTLTGKVVLGGILGLSTVLFGTLF
tara:strand:- start:12172 stop:12543 length:372 start_codon:yes stop_codon:yes gene_type:complete